MPPSTFRPDSPISSRLALILACLVLISALACNFGGLLGPETATPSTMTPDEPTSTATEESTASQESPFLAEGERMEVLPTGRDFEAELELRFEGTGSDGDPVSAAIDRQILSRQQPQYLFRQTRLDVEGVRGLSGGGAPAGEQVSTLILNGDTLYVLQTGAFDSCFMRDVPAQADEVDQPKRAGLLEVEAYLDAASQSVRLVNPNQAELEGQPVLHYRAPNVTIWTDTVATFGVWIEPEGQRIVRTTLTGQGELPPYGVGEFEISAWISELGEVPDPQIPEHCSSPGG